MIRTTTSLVLAVLLAGLATVVSAQPTLKANIPFDFQVRDKMLPAGEYEVLLDINVNNAVIVRNHQNPGLAVVVLTYAAVRPATEKPTAQFNRYGATHLLTTIWTESGRGYAVAPSKATRELAKSRAEIKFVAMK